MVPKSAQAVVEMLALVKANRATRAVRNPDENRMVESPLILRGVDNSWFGQILQGLQMERRFKPGAKPEKRRIVFSSRYALMMAMTATRILAAITAHSPAKRIW